MRSDATDQSADRMDGAADPFSSRTTVSHACAGSVWRYQPSTQGVGSDGASVGHAPGPGLTQPARTDAASTADSHTRISRAHEEAASWRLWNGGRARRDGTLIRAARVAGA